MPAQAGDAHGPDHGPLQAKLLGPFVISLGDKRAGPWPRPTAKRLCQLLLVSADRRISREAAYAAMFPRLNRPAASHGLSAALSYARAALAALGQDAPTLLQADRNYIWVNRSWQIEIDLELHWERLKRSLSAPPGLERDDLLLQVLADEGTLLEDEPYADWALFPREHLERARQDARLALARDRARGWGRSTAEAVAQTWEACFSHDATVRRGGVRPNASVRGSTEVGHGRGNLSPVPRRPRRTRPQDIAGTGTRACRKWPGRNAGGRRWFSRAHKPA